MERREVDLRKIIDLFEIMLAKPEHEEDDVDRLTKALDLIKLYTWTEEEKTNILNSFNEAFRRGMVRSSTSWLSSQLRLANNLLFMNDQGEKIGGMT